MITVDSEFRSSPFYLAAAAQKWNLNQWLDTM